MLKACILHKKLTKTIKVTITFPLIMLPTHLLPHFHHSPFLFSSWVLKPIYIIYNHSFLKPANFAFMIFPYFLLIYLTSFSGFHLLISFLCLVTPESTLLV